jgi:hypothetical protein
MLTSDLVAFHDIARPAMAGPDPPNALREIETAEVEPGPRCLGFGCALLVGLHFTNDFPKVLDVHLQRHPLNEFISGDAGSRNMLHSRGNLD